jgi:hypothetical protein
MDEETKRKRIRNYFKPFPKWALYLAIAGVVILLIGLSGSAGAAIVGLLLAGGGGYAIYASTQGKATDQEMDQWLDEDLKELSPKALKKLGIDQSELISEPIRIHGPILWAANGVSGQDLVWKTGKDRIARFGVYKATLFHLTDKQIGSYQATYNFLKHIPLNESTDEYFYKDIVNVSTKETSTSYSLPNGQKLVSAETFALKVSSGDAVEVVLRDPALEKFTQGQIPTTTAEKAIQSIRTILREKKA